MQGATSRHARVRRTRCVSGTPPVRGQDQGNICTQRRASSSISMSMDPTIHLCSCCAVQAQMYVTPAYDWSKNPGARASPSHHVSMFCLFGCCYYALDDRPAVGMLARSLSLVCQVTCSESMPVCVLLLGPPPLRGPDQAISPSR